MSSGQQKIQILGKDEVRLRVDAATFAIRERTGSGAPWMHVHDRDDEAWYVLEGRLKFRTPENDFEVGPGEVVVVPAGAVHTYQEIEPSRYLLILTPALAEMLDRLHDPSEDTPVDQLLAAYHTRIAE